ncbi:MAG TPA: SUMF1/EgtB/PvdO family nonheme iron enzyme [Terriglobia bacterium]|nr:SUMF1/EgtB/PvdO family nonheme iron enzyme [Terriglobia bacterium]
MIRIAAGPFWMGSENHYSWESPKHRVFVDAFEIAPTSVTRREYAEFLRMIGHEAPRDWQEAEFADPDQPVVGVNWFDAVRYCEWLSEAKGESYRLPTEAEWEKACRGGRTDAEYAWGDEPAESLEYFQGLWPGPRPVATWRANDFGIHNMGDNVHEWCLDWFAVNYYSLSPEANPSGPREGTRRVSRGGSWRHQIKGSRAAHRSSLPPQFRYTDYGFRVVRAVNEVTQSVSK